MSGIEGGAVVGGPTPSIAAAGLGLALIGDSRTRYGMGQWWKNASSAALNGVDIVLEGMTGAGGQIADTTGTLTYTPNPPSLKWQLTGDTAGPVTLMTVGDMTLQSGTAGNQVQLGVHSLLTQPATTQTVSVTISGSQYWNTYYLSGMAAHFLYTLRHPFQNIAWGALGGNTSSNVVEQLPWIGSFSGATGPGIDIIHIGTNDVIGNQTYATVSANLQTIYDARRLLGRRLVLVGLAARWGAAVNTPLTAAQFNVLTQANNFSKAYAAKYPSACIYVDLFNLSCDPGFIDGRPKAGALTDTVHDTAVQAQVHGQAIANALLATGWIQKGPRREQGDRVNLDAQGASGGVGWFTNQGGNTGTLGTGFTGTIPSGWNAGPASGAFTSGVCTAQVGTSADGGQCFQMVLTANGAAIAQVQRNPSLALPYTDTNGLATIRAGDTITWDLEFYLSGITGTVNGVKAIIVFVGTSAQARSLDYGLDGTTGMGACSGVIRTGPVVIPAGCTALNLLVYIDMAAGVPPTVNTASLPPPVQSALSTSTTGGTGLAATTAYFYVVTALDAAGETLKSNEQSITTGAGTTNSNTVSWAAVTGATGYRVYRGTATNAENVYYSPGNVTTYLDTGAAAATGAIGTVQFVNSIVRDPPGFP